jgi:hypothetical protein
LNWCRTGIKLPRFALAAKSLLAYAGTFNVFIMKCISRSVLEIPGETSVGQLFPVKYTIQNSTLSAIDLSASIESSEAFVFSGYKQCCIKLLPLSTRELTLNCLALTSGRCILPKLRLALKKSGSAPSSSVNVSSASSGGPGSASGSASTSRDSLNAPAEGSIVSSSSATGNNASYAALDEVPVWHYGSTMRKEGPKDLIIFVKPNVSW